MPFMHSLYIRVSYSGSYTLDTMHAISSYSYILTVAVFLFCVFIVSYSGIIAICHCLLSCHNCYSNDCLVFLQNSVGKNVSYFVRNSYSICIDFTDKQGLTKKYMHETSTMTLSVLKVSFAYV